MMIRVVFSVVLTCSLTIAVHAQSNEDSPNEPTNAADENETTAPAEDESRVTDLPLHEDLSIPTAQELLTGPKVTWIILNNKRVVISRPITPRPNTLEIQAEQLLDMKLEGAPTNPQKLKVFQDRVYKLRRIRGGFIDAVESPEFLILTSLIESIWHHEDLMLKRAEILTAEEEFDSAYDLLFALRHIDDDWPGLNETHQRLIFQNGIFLRKQKDFNAALGRFEQLSKQNSDYPELSQMLAVTTADLIDIAIAGEDYRRARHFLHRLGQKLPVHPTVTQQTDRLKSQMQQVLNDARSASRSGDHRNAVMLCTKATTIWPYETALRDSYLEYASTFQILKVGVIQPAGSKDNYPFPTKADLRANSIIQRSLFDIHRFDDSSHYHTSLLEQWEPTELGRNLDLTLQTTFDYWNPQTPLSAVQLADSLRFQLDPDHPFFNEQLSGFIEEIHVRSPYRLELKFQRTPLRPEAILSQPIRTSNPSINWVAAVMTNPKHALYRRAIPEAQDVPQPHVTEIHESSFVNHEEILRALFRGEIDYIPELPVEHASQLEGKSDWIVRKYQIPETHFIQIRPGTLLAENSELRRAMLYALDREELLRTTILNGAPAQFGRLTTSVFPSQCRAFNPLVKEISSDPYVARSLTLAAEKALKGKIPTLRMMIPPDSGLLPAISRIIENWERIGIKVVIVTSDDPQPENWDLAYRVITMTEPLTQLWPLLTTQSMTRVADLQILPGWLRQELIQLELSTNWNDARSRLHALHQSLWSEVFYLPLWEVDRFSLARRNLTGLPSSPLHPYQNVNRWVISPWFDQSRP
ncbi:ABC transporter substrate-binding protein [Planctomycetaceae bacterium]|nr:ABC transporter substrate-binding protein [Planctomycetaceae bacterium]